MNEFALERSQLGFNRKLVWNRCKYTLNVKCIDNDLRKYFTLRRQDLASSPEFVCAEQTEEEAVISSEILLTHSHGASGTNNIIDRRPKRCENVNYL